MPTKVRNRKGLKITDLVYLVYPTNTCYINLSNRCPEGLLIDLREGTYQPEGEYIRDIGSYRLYPRKEGRVIGVFDRRNFRHLENMLEAQRKLSDSLHPIPLDA